ncbi:flagellar assembly protein T N-terminal domain-containing protein [Marinobacter sp. JSM 1782161]|uniref:flagellar assembly protein T N-terminal domain-containing protein n=1 Tax=Marinobacter sp. JSM 1782161 TaxID=2685906 RepID=UPI0014020DDD|nr:flagellar assembly protein T N-terminal domain-containing protein [Marinobacter sp. JSM 1782161]
MVVLRRLLIGLAFASQVQAAWHSGEGSAAIINDNYGFAMREAAQAAIRDAVLSAGASVSLVKDVDVQLASPEGGVLFVTRDGGLIRSVQLVKEYEYDARARVQLRLDITRADQVCGAPPISKSVTLLPFTLDTADQSAWGQLERLPEALTERFRDALDGVPKDFLVNEVVDRPLPIQVSAGSRDRPAGREYRYLAERSRSQYVMQGRIDNISLGQVDGGLLGGDSLVRQFSMTVDIIDGLSGDVIRSQQYRTRTVWPFEATERVGVDSDRFWDSEYGLEVERLMKTAVDDMAGLVACARPAARVIRVQPNRVDVAIGSRQGLRRDTVFRLKYEERFIDDQGVSYASFSDSGLDFEVVRVFPDHSVLAPVTGIMPASIQVRDLVQLDSFWE